VWEPKPVEPADTTAVIDSTIAPVAEAKTPAAETPADTHTDSINTQA